MEARRTIRDGWYEMQREYLEKQFRYMVRVTLQIKDNGIGKFDYDLAGERAKRGLNEPSGYPNEGNHIAIFECPIK